MWHVSRLLAGLSTSEVKSTSATVCTQAVNFVWVEAQDINSEKIRTQFAVCLRSQCMVCLKLFACAGLLDRKVCVQCMTHTFRVSLVLAQHGSHDEAIWPTTITAGRYRHGQKFDCSYACSSQG